MILLFLDPRGRIGRRPYLGGLAVILFMAGIATLLGLLIPRVAIVGLSMLAWPHLTIAIKRLHDLGASGWMLLVPVAIAHVVVIGGVVASKFATDMGEVIAVAMLILLGGILTALAFWIALGVIPGQRRDNRYGPDPQGRDIVR